jgi:cysteine-rich repeat protein
LRPRIWLAHALGFVLALAPASGFAATFVVDDTTDAVDVAAGDGTCATAAGSCTLRAAIQETNALAGSDEIEISAGEYVLAIPGSDEDEAATGDLDVTGSLSVTGAAAASTIIDGARLDRVLDITSSGAVVITGVTIRNGSAPSGAGIRIAGGTLQLADSAMHDNEADDLGGGIDNELGVLALVGSTLSGNVAHSSGGGIDNSGTAWIINSTLSGNVADVLGGGLCNVGTAVLSNATIAANVLSGVDNDGQLVVRNTILAENAGTDCSGVLTSHGFNLFRNPSGCLIEGNTSGDLVGMDPALGLLADNGGPTPTHALLAGSAALDTGNPATPGGPAGCESTDQRGVSRPQGFRCDIGAFEASACGNAVADAGEACEDGNLTDGDGCDSNCTVTACGNGIVTDGEECDDGNQDDGDGCSVDCRSTTGSACGNGAIDTDDACDDANGVDGDGCDSNCTVTACGNGVATVGEQCDDGNVIDGDGCSSTCEADGQRLLCGDGTLDPSETCDDGNLIDGDGCDGNCTTTGCANGIVTEDEGCDDGNQTDGDGCSSVCQFEAGNAAPDCSAATVDPDHIWPPNHKFVPLSIGGVVEPDGDPTTITIVGITQDEPVISSFAGAFARHSEPGDRHEDNEDTDEDDEEDTEEDEADSEDDETDDDPAKPGTCPDAAGIGTSTASVRAERDENGDGRVYHVTFRADDGRGGQCTGTVTVCVPHDMGAGATCVDQGPLTSSTPRECPAACVIDGCDGDYCDPASRFLSIECVLETPLCEGEDVPGGVTKRLAKARGMLEDAYQADNRWRERKLVKKAVRHLAKASRIFRGVVKHGTVSAECAAELRGMLYEAKTRTVSWLKSMRDR